LAETAVWRRDAGIGEVGLSGRRSPGQVPFGRNQTGFGA